MGKLDKNIAAVRPTKSAHAGGGVQTLSNNKAEHRHDSLEHRFRVGA
jgi:hypothetical protein